MFNSERDLRYCEWAEVLLRLKAAATTGLLMRACIRLERPLHRVVEPLDDTVTFAMDSYVHRLLIYDPVWCGRDDNDNVGRDTCMVSRSLSSQRVLATFITEGFGRWLGSGRCLGTETRQARYKQL